MERMELSVLDWIQAHLRCGVLDMLMPWVSCICNHGEVWIILALILLICPRTRRAGICLACGLFVDLLVCNVCLKPMIGRVRPFVVNPEITLLIAPPGEASFPSGHTASSFAAVLALWRAKSQLWRPALVLAVLLAFSRLYLYVHWPSDILGGVLVGALAGWIGAELALWIQNRGLFHRGDSLKRGG